MTNILFCLHADRAKTPERLQFLEAVQATLTAQNSPLKIIVFNESGWESSKYIQIQNASDWPALETRDASRQLKTHLTKALGSKSGWWLKQATDEGVVKFGDRDRAAQIFLRKFLSFTQIFEQTDAKHVYLWNAFNSFHRVLRTLVERKGGTVSFFHDGVIPGSLSIDFDGEMGESWVAREPERLLSVPVTEGDLERAQTYLAALKASAVTRHAPNPGVDLKGALVAAGLNNKPLILYAGQNDWHAGIQPDSKARRHHSPLYATSTSALPDLDKAASALGAAVLFKPHPNDRDRLVFLKDGPLKQTLILKDCDMAEAMDMASVIVTIASQTCYGAAMMGKPVVMLGRNQITAKGMTLDLTSRSDLQSMLGKAMQSHDPAGQEQALIKHIAQLNAAYLYHFKQLPGEDPENESYFTQGPAEFAERLTAQASGAKADSLIASRLVTKSQQKQPVQPV